MQGLKNIVVIRRMFGWLGCLKWWLLRGQAAPVRLFSAKLGRFVLLRPDSTDLLVAMKILYHKEYELPWGFAPDVIIDAGANVGMSTLYFAASYPGARIIAVEPEPSNCEMLKANCAGLPNVEIRQAAVWGAHARLALADPSADKWSFAFKEDAAGGGVEAVTVDDLLRGVRTDARVMVKFDIEGAEREVFAQEHLPWLERVHVLLIELHDRFQPGCSRAFYSQMVRRPFAQELRGENVMINFETPAARASQV